MTIVNNRKCMLCGDSFHMCSTCDLPGQWAWCYCSEECWQSSFKGMQCLALGDKLARVLEPHEVALLKEGIQDESHYLDRVLDGLKLSRD